MRPYSRDEIVVIGAVSPTHAIGSGGGMPWNVPEEYQHFVSSVTGQVVIMGRKSYEIFGADFEAEIFVITRRPSVAGARVCSSIGEAIAQAKTMGRAVFIAGGRSVYELGIPFASRMVLSTIKGDYEGDVYFPEYDERPWQLVFEEDRGNYVLRDWERVEIIDSASSG